MQHLAIPCSTMQYQCNTITNNAIPYWYNSIPCSIIRCYAIQWINMHFWPKNGNFWQLWPYNSMPSSRMGTYRKTEGIQSYLKIWGCYDPIESGPSDPKKWGLYRRSVKKCRFSGQNRAPAAAPRPAVQRGQHKNVVFLLSGHDGNKKVGWFWKKMDFGPKNKLLQSWRDT